MPQPPETGLIIRRSLHSVDETVSHLQQLLEAKGVKIFAVVDHSGEARKAGLEMPNTKLILFGSPKAGTPLMLAAPTIAIDLPLKILIWEDAESKTCIGYNSPEYLSGRHHLPSGLMAALSAAGALAGQIAE